MTLIFAFIWRWNIVKNSFIITTNQNSNIYHATAILQIDLLCPLFQSDYSFVVSSVFTHPPIKHTSILHFLSQSSAHLILISFSISIIINQSLCSGVCLHYISGSRTSVRPQQVLGLFPILRKCILRLSGDDWWATYTPTHGHSCYLLYSNNFLWLLFTPLIMSKIVHPI